MLLQVLRETLNCKLPIEIYHFPDEMKDEKVRADLIAWGGVKVVEVSVGSGGKVYKGEGLGGAHGWASFCAYCSRG